MGLLLRWTGGCGLRSSAHGSAKRCAARRDAGFREKWDQTPDAIGISAKRSLLEAVVRDDPESGAFEAWLVDDVASLAPGWTNSAGGAMAQAVFEECQLAQRMTAFSQWLSDDVEVRRVPSR
jgi:hypothetical protein